MNIDKKAEERARIKIKQDLHKEAQDNIKTQMIRDMVRNTKGI